jgi:hypothetical protein
MRRAATIKTRGRFNRLRADKKPGAEMTVGQQGTLHVQNSIILNLYYRASVFDFCFPSVPRTTPLNL